MLLTMDGVRQTHALQPHPMLTVASTPPMTAPKSGESLYSAAVMAVAEVSTAAHATPAKAWTRVRTGPCPETNQ